MVYRSRQALTLTLIALVALVITAGAPAAAPRARAQERPRVAYVYSTDTYSRDSFVAELELRGFDVTPISLAEAGADADPNFSQYGIIIIGQDTGDVTGAAGWQGSTLARDRIARAQRYTVGFGIGGAQFFGTLQLDIGYAGGVGGSGRELQAVNPGAGAWTSPNPVPIEADGSVRLYTGNVGGWFARPANLSGVTLIGRVPLQDGFAYPIAAELPSPTAPGPCYLLWGHRGPPALMTAAGRALLENLLRASPCAAQPPPRADVAITKEAPQSGQVGLNLTYTLRVSAGRAPAPGVSVTDELPAGVALVSATPSQGSCRLASRRVVCELGDLPGGGAATVTIVVRPGEVGPLVNVAYASGRFEDTNPANNRAEATTTVGFSAILPPLRALPFRPIFTGPIVALPQSDLSIHGIEVTQGIQCFDTSKGLSGCADNALPQVARKSTVARIYARYSGPAGSMNNVPVRLVLIDANNVEYVVNTVGKALPAIDQSSAANSANVYFSVNFNSAVPVRYYAIVDPTNTIAETNEGNNRFPATGTRSITFTPSQPMRIVGQRLRYHPSGYSGAQYAGGWAVNGGAATWFEQLLPVRSGGVSYQVASGYLNWTTSLGGSDGQHALIREMNTRWIKQNVFSWLFGTGAYTNARHVYGFAPNDGYGGGHADMPVYPHAGGLGVVGIGTDRPGTGSDTPGGGALIFGHELIHNYDVRHTNTADSCGSSDDSSPWPYSGSSIQEYGFNPVTGKVYDPALTHDVMSYCPAGGSKEGWIAPYTWSYMFNRLRASSKAAEPAQVADAVLAVNLTVSNPERGADQGAFTDVARVNTATPLVIPPPGDYAVQLRGAGEAILATHPFTVTFKSEYTAHDDHPGDPEDLATASAHMIVPWVEGTQRLVILHNDTVIGSRAVSAAAPVVLLTRPDAPATWAAGTTETISWEARDPDGDALTYTVLYSRDGDQWDILAEGLTETSLSVAVDDLAGGEARFRVVASDGVNIGDDESPPIMVPDKAPTAGILNPLQNADVPPGQLLVLQGFGSDFEDGLLPDVALRWRSDRAGDLGAGASLPVNDLAPGPHTITLVATDSAGQTTTATAQIYVGSRLHLPMLMR